MNTLLHYSITIAFILFSFTIGNAQSKRVKGNGNVSTKIHTTEDYNEVSVVGFMDVFLENGKEGSITVTTDENIHEYVSIESKNGKLIIKIKNNVNISTKNGLHITVPFIDLDNVSLTGSGDVLTKSVIKTTAFEVELTGSGDMILEVEATTIDAKITGSGDLRLTGKSNELEIKITGSGDFVSKNLKSQRVEAYVSGSGDASVYASESIKARVHGSGDIIYYGNPKTSNNKVMGSGDIDSN